MIRSFAGVRGAFAPVIWLAIAFSFAAYGIWLHQFIQDDAYISFRYAKHFAAGHGLVWYPGSTEFGFTSPLFTFLIGIWIFMGVPPETGAFLITIPACFITIWLTYRISRRISDSWIPGIVAALALSTNISFTSYATGGLETMLQTCLVVAVYFHLIAWCQERRQALLWRVALISMLALLTRLDSALLLLPAYVVMAAIVAGELGRGRQSFSSAVRSLGITAGIPALAVVVLLLACYFYYGYALPNTFYVKLEDQAYAESGVRYYLSFLIAQKWVPLKMLGVAALLLLWRTRSAGAWRYPLLLLAPVAVWSAYIIYIGGDFMEFRMFVPVMPFFYLAVANMAVGGRGKYRSVIAAVLCYILMYGNYAQSFYFPKHKGIDKNMTQSTREMHYLVTNEREGWIRIGQNLHRLFYTGSDNDVNISVTAAGAIAYYSQLPVINEYGFNAWKHFPERARHRMVARYAWLQGVAKVTLMINHPTAYRKLDNGEFCVVARRKVVDRPKPNSKAAVLIHLYENMYLMAHYVNPHPAVERLIEEGVILTSRKGKLPLRCPSKGARKATTSSTVSAPKH